MHDERWFPTSITSQLNLLVDDFLNLTGFQNPLRLRGTLSLAPMETTSFFCDVLKKAWQKRYSASTTLSINYQREIAPKKWFRGNCFEFEILRNKKPEISTTSGFDISLYCYSKNVPNHEALPLQKANLLLNVN